MTDVQDVLNTAAAELIALHERLVRSSDLTQGQLNLDRWRERTIELLENHVSAQEASRLANMRGRPTWVERDNLLSVFDAHRSFVLSLANDVERNPAHYGRSATRGSRDLSQRRGPAPPLTVPSKITLTWLFTHVPLWLWGSAFVLIFGAFVLGLRLAMSPEIRKLLSEIPFFPK